jgi:periplasmic protein TonB
MARTASDNFDPLFAYGESQQGPQHWFAAFFSSSLLYVLVGVAVVTIGTATKQIIQEKKVDLTFVETVVKEPPPPPPPAPIVEDKPKPPPAAAPVIPKNMKVRKLDAPPPPKELVAPKEMPLEKPKEADPSQDKGVAVYGDLKGPGDAAGLEGGMEGGVVGGHVGAIELPEDADPPKPADANAPPPYPEVARANGKTDTVILKVVILASGNVGEVQVMRGDEPFASAAVAAVKKWHYDPARYKGQAITVYRIIRIPFKLTV